MASRELWANAHNSQQPELIEGKKKGKLQTQINNNYYEDKNIYSIFDDDVLFCGLWPEQSLESK